MNLKEKEIDLAYSRPAVEENNLNLFGLKKMERRGLLTENNLFLYLKEVPWTGRNQASHFRIS